MIYRYYQQKNKEVNLDKNLDNKEIISHLKNTSFINNFKSKIALNQD